MSAFRALSFSRTRNGCRRQTVADQSLNSEAPYWIESVVVGDLTYLQDHRVAGEVVYPAAGFSVAGIAVHQALRGPGYRQKPIFLSDLKFRRALPLADADSTVLRIDYEPNQHEFAVYSHFRDDHRAAILHATGRLTQSSIDHAAPNLELDKLLTRYDESIDVAHFYQRLRQSGLDYGPFFQAVHEIRICRHTSEAVTRLSLHPELAQTPALWAKPITLLDAAFQSLAATLGVGNLELYVPSRIQTVSIHGDFEPDLWCYARLAKSTSRAVVGDITLFGEEGHPLIEIRGLRCLKIPRGQPIDSDKAIELQNTQVSRQNYSYR